jgi:DnaJ-class molecular chaperone
MYAAISPKCNKVFRPRALPNCQKCDGTGVRRDGETYNVCKTCAGAGR